jgi:hypothetical protein
MIKVAEKPETPPPSLDELIMIILKDPGDRPAVLFSVILDQIKRASAAAEQEGKAAQAAAYDPAVLDPTAVGRSHDAAHRIKRLTNAAEALAPHHAAAIKREAQAAWESEACVVRQKVTDLAKELASTWPATVMRLVKLFEMIAVIDREASAINSRAPTGVNHLRSVEASIGKGEKIIERVRLPVLTDKGVVDMWPPRNNWALDYAESVRAGIVGAGMPATEAERIEASERQIDFVKAQEAGREKLNAEAHARAEANAAEQRRLQAGELPR